MRMHPLQRYAAIAEALDRLAAVLRQSSPGSHYTSLARRGLTLAEIRKQQLEPALRLTSDLTCVFGNSVEATMRAFRLIVAAIAAAAGLVVLLMTPRLFVQAAPNVICTWTGPKDSTPRSWSAASNWSCGKAPGAGDTAIVSGGGIVIDVDVPVTVQDLTLAAQF